jgi:competence protein ComEC
MALYTAHFWKKAPFVKLLPAFAAGIIIQWFLQPDFQIWLIVLLTGLGSIVVFLSLPFFSQYRFSFLTGVAFSAVFAAAGGMLAWNKDVRKGKDWLGHSYKNGETLIAVLDEPPVEKTKSFKADANVQYVIRGGLQIPARCRIILYFRKDSASQIDSLPSHLFYGSRIIFKKPLQEIKNSGNPGGFDYKRYSLFRGITYQVFLKRDEYEIIPGKTINPAKQVIYSTRQKILDILRKNITAPKELGLAEALLIGYKDDLEQSLVQSYTNTGVVHIIAISGLHLGLIYWLLALVLKPLTRNKKSKWLRPLLIIIGLWAFSLLAGAQPSVLRSAFMFSFIVLGESFSRKSSIYNTMAVSAFLLLCINPYWLWDVGFQLSYAAVLSIIIFMRPIYNWFYFENKTLAFIWKLNAVTLAAQVLTIPLSVYHFHQFPPLFFLTNFLAVPLSGIILLAEILLCCIFFVPAAALLLGKVLRWLIWVMNTYIEEIEHIPGSLWDGLQITISQTALLIVFAAGISYWMIEKQKQGFYWGLAAFLLFTMIRTLRFLESNQQQKIIVYNVPQKTAIDFIDGRKFQFVGDSDLLHEGFARNFHLKPTRTLLRISKADSVQEFQRNGKFITYKGHHVMITGEPLSFDTSIAKQTVDLLIISKNPRLYFKNLVTALDIKQVVFDGSTPAWKVNYWKKHCDSLNVPWHDVSTKGAFVMNLR